jgi:hypothetical protein
LLLCISKVYRIDFELIGTIFLSLYNDCYRLGRCRYNGNTWTINEIQKLIYTITTACGSRGDRSYPFGLVDEEFEASRRMLLELVTSRKGQAARIIDNSEDPSFKDKIIPFLREVVIMK